MAGGGQAVVATADEPEEESEPDPYLVESGHILLDLISLEERTAAEQNTANNS